MKPVKNIFLKWLFHLFREERSGVITAFNKTGETATDIIKKSFHKYNSWIKRGNYKEADFDRHRKSIRKHFFNNDDTITTNEIHKLKNDFDDFLIINEAKFNPQLQHKILAKNAKRHHFHEAFFYHLHKREELNIEKKTYSFDHWLERFDINYNRFFHPRFTKDKEQVTINDRNYHPKTVLENAWIDLHKFSLTAQIRMACELKTREIIYDESFKYFSKKEIDLLIHQINEFSFEELATAHIYVELYHWVSINPMFNFKEFLIFKNRLLSHISLFSNNEQVAIIILLLNKAANLYNQGNLKGQELYYEFSKFAFDNHIFGNETPVESSLFMNIYDLTYQSYPQFAEKLLSDYSSQMLQTDKVWITTFFSTRQLFNENDFVAAFRKIQPLKNHKNYSLTIRKYILMLQCQYEARQAEDKGAFQPNEKIMNRITDDDAVVKNIKIFNKAINDAQYFEQPSKVIKDAALNFSKIFYRLLKNYTTYNAIDVSETKKQLAPLSVYSKQWLIKKLDELS